MRLRDFFFSFFLLAAYREPISPRGCCPVNKTCGDFEFPAPIGDGFKGAHAYTHARVRLRKHTWTMRREKQCNRNMRVFPRWEGTWSQRRETTPRRVRNYAAKSPVFSDTKRAVLKHKNKLRHANVETTPQHSNLGQRFPSFHDRTLAAEIPYVELKYLVS